MSDEKIGRTPDYRLSVKAKASGEKAKQGAGWVNPDGSITVRLDLCAVLKSDPNILITLFPVDKK